MSTLIVTAHPNTDSLTRQVALRLHGLLGSTESSLAHLADEGFDPRFSSTDVGVYQTRGKPDGAVAFEQARLAAVDHVVLVFPVYWWSMPALLKGWIDRVFIAGWAFGYDEADRLIPQLGNLTAHLLPISATTADTFSRHGYPGAFSTQIEHGIIDFCGMQRGATAFIYDSESPFRDTIEASVEAATRKIAAAITDAVR